MNSRESHQVSFNEFLEKQSGHIELYVNNIYVADWHYSGKTPVGLIPNATAQKIAQEAYKSGYKAAKLDLKDWVG